MNEAGDGPVVSSIFLVTIIACAAGALIVLTFAKWDTGYLVIVGNEWGFVLGVVSRWHLNKVPHLFNSQVLEVG